MEFDRSKILTVVTADQAKVGQKGWFSSNIDNLAYLVREEQPKELLGVNAYNAVHAFKTVFQNHALFYPAPEQTYAERQAEWIKKHNLKEGDKVKVLRTAKGGEDGWNNSWTESMNRLVGSVFTYDRAYQSGINLSCGYNWPYFVLEVIKEPTYRPFKNDELNSLVGKVLTQKGCGYPCLVTQRYSMTQVCVNGYLYNAQQLLELFALDGKPCGIKEEADV